MTARIAYLTLISLILLAGCQGSSDSTPADAAGSAEVSGVVEGGLRVLTVDPHATDHDFTIYRGDYVRFRLASGEPFTIEIPARETTKSYPVTGEDKPYVKFPAAGSFPYTVGDVSGVITALEFQATAYREAQGLDAAEVIANLDPVILDVRTRREFDSGHIEGAILIPVQEIQRRHGELAEHKNDPVFIYCRSGNRSTVAAKVLIDAGFTQIINLRPGIKDWVRHDLPVVK